MSTGHRNRHIATVHQGERNFQCHLCGYNFTDKGNMKKHILTVHEGKKLIIKKSGPKKSHKCSLCDRIFSEQTQLSFAVL